MSTSGQSVGFHRFCVKYMPFLLRKCPGENLHFVWNRLCGCMYNCNGEKYFYWQNNQWISLK